MCATCATPFTPKRGWSRFCSLRCRNAFHGSERRVEAIKNAALTLYWALKDIAKEDGTPYGTQAAAALAGLKDPLTPAEMLAAAKPKA